MGVALDIWKKKEFDKGVAEGRRLEREAQRRRDSNHAPAANDHEDSHSEKR